MSKGKNQLRDMWDEPKSDENTNVDERILRSFTSSDSDFPKQLQTLTDSDNKSESEPFPRSFEYDGPRVQKSY